MLSTVLVSVALLSAPALAATGQLGDAAITTNNIASASYQAVLPNSNTTGIRGQITGTSNANGTGVVYNINFYGFPDEMANGPFLYHIHVAPVPSNGNCTATLGHLDPYIRGEMPPCDATQPQTCQVGDLSGKHGNITTSTFQTTYLDLYTTTTEGLGSFFGNRSVVVHNQNLTRLTCANFTMAYAGYGGPNASMTGSMPAQYTGAASSLGKGAVTAVTMLLFTSALAFML